MSVSESPDLTPREQEVARLVGRGMDAQQISWAIGCRTGTVYQHVSNISAKIPGPVKRWKRVMIWAAKHLP